jgi:hypothetical protein
MRFARILFRSINFTPTDFQQNYNAISFLNREPNCRTCKNYVPFPYPNNTIIDLSDPLFGNCKKYSSNAVKCRIDQYKCGIQAKDYESKNP